MPQTTKYRPLTDDEIKILTQQGCSSLNWADITVAPDFDPIRVRNTHFTGSVKLGSFKGNITSNPGVEKATGIYNAYIANTTTGDNCRIANINVHLANYDIADNVAIENVGTMETSPNATFGNGVEIEVLNEAGGREIILFNELSSQFAHLICLHRYRSKLIDKLNALAKQAAASVKSDRGSVGSGTRITSVPQIINVNIGANAAITAAASLINGSILSTPDAPTTIGANVQAEDFIIAESTTVDSGAIISKTYIGQGCQIGKQFSAENCAFFANCEGFHSEACSIFAGPYSVTHHKSTLLIAGLFSFYNAGSGTNQSNHMYKLGPVHEGKLERGTKTGSFSYMMWPCRVGPFSSILGKHSRNFDTSDFPFAQIMADHNGKCSMIPGFTLATVGTVRDGAKWPSRDRRKGNLKRDRISFDIFSPYTVGRMIRGSAILKELQQNTDKSIDTVNIKGAEIKRVLLRTSQKFYRSGIHMYLLEKVVSHIEQAIDSGAKSLNEALAAAPDAVFSDVWVDIGSQLMPQARLDKLATDVAAGSIATLDDLNNALDDIFAAYEIDEWAFVRHAFKQVFEINLDNPTANDINKSADDLLTVKGNFLKLVMLDATKEFDEVTQTGFGQDGSPKDAAPDFTAVRGEYDANKFVIEMKQSIERLQQRINRFKKSIKAF